MRVLAVSASACGHEASEREIERRVKGTISDVPYEPCICGNARLSLTQRAAAQLGDERACTSARWGVLMRQ